MRVVHFAGSSDTGHVVPWCGVWGSRDTDWTAVAAGVTCVACRDVMRAGSPGDEASARVSATARRRAPGRPSFALRHVGVALVAWLGAWALLAVSADLPAAGSGATTVAVGIAVVILALSGAAFAALAGKELVPGLPRGRSQVRG